MIYKVSVPYLDWGAESTLHSISLYLIPYQQKLAPSLERKVVLAKQFETQSFRTLFGLGGGRINPSFYISVSNSLRMVVMAKWFDKLSTRTLLGLGRTESAILSIGLYLIP